MNIDSSFSSTCAAVTTRGVYHVRIARVPPRDAWLIDQDGRRFELAEAFTIGRARQCDLVVSSMLVQRQHVRLTRLPSDEVEAEDLGTTNGTFVNGQRITHRVLKPGDVLDVVMPPLRFEQGPPVQAPRDEALERVVRAWDDDTALQVVIDSLLEQGDPLGQALALGTPQPLEPELQDAVKRDVLRLGLKRGFIREARLRPGSWLERRPLVRVLLRSKAAQLISALTLPQYEPRLRLEATPVPTLKTLRFGPWFAREAAAEALEALAATSFPGMPGLAPPAVDLFLGAWLDFGAGQRRNLNPGRQETFPTVAVRWDEDRWFVDSSGTTRAVKLNGVRVSNAFLLPDDVVEAGPLRFTFRASAEAPR
jgi:hypothetical protein